MHEFVYKTITTCFCCRLLPVFEQTLEELLYLKRKSIGISRHQEYISKRKHISSLEIVSKKTIYGMFIDPMFFIKVLVYDPQDIGRLAIILDVRKRLLKLI
jgi:hypothetical protein